MTSRRQIVHRASALLVPFLVQSLLVVGMRTIEARVPKLGDLGAAAPLISSAVGFLLIARDLTREQMILIGVIYFVGMYPFLMYFTLILVGNLYGEWL